MTPEELEQVRPRLEAFAARMPAGLARADQRAKGELYVRGLMLDGRRNDARHTAVSLMADAGVNPEVRMREVGHADRSVHSRYTHLMDDAHRAAAEQVGALVAKAGKT